MLSALSEAEGASEIRLDGAAAPLLEQLLHAMGQPLTSLQLCRVPTTRSADGGSGRELLLDFAGQVESLTEMYRALRLLVEGCRGQAEATDMAALARRLGRSWHRRAAQRGLVLKLEVDSAPVRVLGGPIVEQALEGIFDAVLDGLVTESAQEVTVWAKEAELLIGGWPSGVAATETWLLRVARVLIEKAGGSVGDAGQTTCARVRLARA